jgi:hypothetical protein
MSPYFNPPSTSEPYDGTTTALGVLLGDIDVALTKCLQIDLLVVGPEDNKCVPLPKVKRLLHLGPSPLEGDPEMTSQRACPGAHLDHPKGITH